MKNLETIKRDNFTSREEELSTKKFRFNVHVESMSKCDREIAERIVHAYSGDRYFVFPEKVKIKIDYPLSVDVFFTLENQKTLSGLLWEVSKVYVDIIYDNPDKFGVWGHGVHDLYFEGLTIFSDGYVELSIGS